MNSFIPRTLGLFIALLLLMSSSIVASECIEVVTEHATITKAPSGRSLAIGMAARGQRYRVDGKFRNLFKIEFKRKSGWISKNDVRFIVCPSDLVQAKEEHDSLADINPAIAFMHTHKDLVALSGFVLLIALIITVAILIDLRPRRRREERYALLIGSPNTSLASEGKNAPPSLEQFFAKHKLHYSHARLIENVRRHLSFYIPDVILVDWNHSRTIAQEVENALLAVSSSEGVLVIIFNIPGGLIPTIHPRLTNIELFSALTDSRLHKTITNFLQNRGHRSTVQIRRETAPAALAGELAENSLADVFQMVEMGGKTGCLLINHQNQPFGMVGFENGMITFAATKSCQQRPAVYQLLDMHQGDFRFVANKAPKSRNCMIATIEILMTWAQQKDEAVRGDSAPPTLPPTRSPA